MIGAALLLLAAQPAAPAPAPPASTAAAPSRFAPPTDRPMVYRVTTRRLARDGALDTYTLTYSLRWTRAGRGVQLVATLRGIESDAAPELRRAVTGLLRPLVDQPITYLIASDGSSVDLVDPEALWQRVLGRARDMGAGASRGEAQQMAGLLAALPPAEREKLATADIRALIAPANPDIPAIGNAVAGQHGPLRTVTKSETTSVGAGAAKGGEPIEIDTVWSVDAATGLVVSERRQTWIAAGKSTERKLVEERLRVLDAGNSS